MIFLKAPRPGEVKTRLAASLGPKAAADLYRLLAEQEVRRTLPRPGEYERLFFFSPADASAEIQSWFPGATLVPQQGADLGARMATAFDEAFGRGARRVAVIGSDVPWVCREIVREAFCSLDDHHVVLGPAGDGGYYLMALDRPRPGLFQGIAWSTPSVLMATAERARALGLRVRLLDVLPDIDTLDDVRREWWRLEPLLEGHPEIRETLRSALG